MKLPNAERAIVDGAKVSDYLLNVAHPDNGGKARFFTHLGFARSDPATLEAALRALAVAEDVGRQADSPHGRKFVIDGAIQGPNGRSAVVRTIWIIDAGQGVPRLVTAYPVGL